MKIKIVDGLIVGFYFALNSFSQAQIVANGTYEVVSLNSGLVLGASGTSTGSQVQQQTYSAAATQKWMVTNLGNNVVEMGVSGTSEAMEVVGAGTAINNLLDITSYTGATNQQWTITQTGSYLELVNVNSGLAANVPGWQTQSGIQLIQYNPTPASTNQEWTFSAAGGATTYALTVTNGAGSGTYAAGTAVTVTANAPASGYQFAGWTGATSALANPALPTTTLTMPAAATAVTATYSAVPTYALTVNSGSGSGTYAAGTVVTVTANAPANGYQFNGWTGATSALANPASASTKLTMPATAIAITASYSLINNTTYALTVSSGTGGGSYAAGTVVSIAANAAPAGQVFSQWTGGGSSIASATSSNTTVTMPSNALTVTATYVSSSQGTTPVYGLAAMQQFSNLPYLNPTIMAGGQSSFDRTGGNYDSNNYLYTDASGDAVMLDQQGPGCVYRIWVTGSWTSTDYLKVYFNGATTPQINIPLTTLFAGATAPFLAPLVGNGSVSSGGYFCYLPLPYSNSIKITTSVAGKSPFFYNIGYHAYPPGTSVTTWTGNENSSAIQSIWNSVGTDPKSTTGNVTASGPVNNFTPGTTQTLLNLAGPNSLSSIKLTIPGITATSNTSTAALDILNNTWIKIYWDGSSTPSVNAPIGAFFGLGRFGNSVQVASLPVGIDSGNNLYMYFPMPFAGNATVQLVNQRTSTTTGINYSIAYQPFTGSFTNVGYFTTLYRDDSVNAFDGNDKTILDTDGHGSFVGVVDSMSGATSRWYLEGDEKIFVDGSESPAFQGTGTEDFFNGGYYFGNGPFSLQMQGNPAHVTNSTDNTSAYRFFLQDAIPFRNHIRVAIEHGTEDDSTEEMWTLAYYYLQPGSIATLTDLINVGNATSESNHSYSITSQTLSNSQSYTYEGDEGCLSLTRITDDGRAFTGSSQFTANISSTNTGVILRRRFDQTVPSQSANVYVNGSLVGTWYRAGGNTNHQWRDDDFMIPSSVTSGRSQIQIQIQYVSGGAWNEYTYYVYSLSQQPAATYTLTTNATNGSVVLNPPGGVYPAGTVVTVTALPSTGYTFNNWTGALTSTVDPTTLTMTGNQTITANFVAGTPTLGNTKSATNNLAQTGAGESAFYAIDHAGDALTVMTNGVKSESDDSYDLNYKTNDYWGIAFSQVYGFNKVVYTTGNIFSDGGWFSSGLTVQVRQYGVWVNVTGVSVSPAYPYTNAAGTNVDYTFTFNNTWGDAIRIYGVPGMVSGDEYSFTAIGELGIFYTP